MFVDLSLNSKKYCGTQPLCVRCFNRNEVVVDSWNSVFVEVCCALYKKNPIRFEKSTRTETFSRVILPSAQNMRKPALFVAGHYVETDFEDYEIIDWIKRLIDRLGIAAEAIVISYQLENLHVDGSDKMVRPTSSPEMAQNSQIETNDLFKTISSEFNAWNGILKFGAVSSFAEFIYARPESLSVYSGFGHIESARNVVSYQFSSWVDILERILILLAQSQPDQVLLCLKKHCGSVASVSQTKGGLKKPILLFDQNYIDLFAFENDIPATVECICKLVRSLKIKSDECVIHFVVDETLVQSTKNDMNAESPHDSSELSVVSDVRTEQEETSDSKVELSDSNVDSNSEDVDEETDSDSEELDEETDSDSEELDEETDSVSEELDEETDSDSEELDEETDSDSEELDEETDSDSEDVDEETDEDSEDVEDDTEPAKKQVYYQFSLEKNYQLWADGTPVALYWRGEEVSVDSWPELFEEFCEKMLDECEERFIHILTDSELVSEDEDELRLPYRIRGEELYIETDRPAVRVMQLMAIWCSECGIPKDEIEIETMEWEDVEDEDDEDDIDDDEYEDEEDDDEEDDDEEDDDEYEDEELDEDEDEDEDE